MLGKSKRLARSNAVLRKISGRFPLWFKLVTSLTMIFAVSASAVLLVSRRGPGFDLQSYANMLSRVRRNGTIRVMVEFEVPSWPKGMPDDLREVLEKNDEIQRQQNLLLAELGSHQAIVLPVYWAIPLVSLQVDEQALLRLMNSSRVVSIVAYREDDYYSSGVTYSPGTNNPNPYSGGIPQPNNSGRNVIP
jgi:hypothetical protein